MNIFLERNKSVNINVYTSFSFKIRNLKVVKFHLYIQKASFVHTFRKCEMLRGVFSYPVVFFQCIF